MKISSWTDQFGTRRCNGTVKTEGPACATQIHYGEQHSAVFTHGTRFIHKNLKKGDGTIVAADFKNCDVKKIK